MFGTGLTLVSRETATGVVLWGSIDQPAGAVAELIQWLVRGNPLARRSTLGLDTPSCGSRQYLAPCGI